MSLEDLTMFNMKEVAALLHVSEGRARQLISRGRLRGFVHIGRGNKKRLMVMESDLKNYIYSVYLEQYWPGNKRPETMPKRIPECVSVKNKKGKDDYEE